MRLVGAGGEWLCECVWEAGRVTWYCVWDGRRGVKGGYKGTQDRQV